MATGELQIRVRRMTEADLPKVREIDQELVGPDRSVSWPLRVEAHWWVYRGMPNFVAELDDRIVGFILGDLRGSEYGPEVSGWIDVMGVSPEHQGKGIGRRLVEAFCGECRGQGFNVRIVAVGSDNRLSRFATSLGFTKGDLVGYEK